MSRSHSSQNTNDRADPGRKHDQHKTNPTLRIGPFRRESKAIHDKDLRTLASGKGTTVLTFRRKHRVFSQGEVADAAFYIQEGQVKLTVISQQGKEAVVALLERGAFFGESCLAGQMVRMVTATVLEDSRIERIDKDAMIRLLQETPTFTEVFLTHLLSRNMRIQEDLVDQLFNPSEKRLARVLLLLAHCVNESTPETVIPKISQETLAEMIGTTRSRVSFFMNKFRKLRCIDYNHDGLQVRRTLLNSILQD